MSFTKQLIKELVSTRCITGSEPKKLNPISSIECESITSLIQKSKSKGIGSFYSNNSDYRVFRMKEYKSEFPELWQLINEHLPDNWFIGPIMGAHLTSTPDSIGSGEGWHRDSWFGQKKIIIYLNDVTNKNGPFQYIPGTSQLKYKLLRVAEGKSDRIADNEINANKIVTLTGKAGTSYLFDGTMVHRGKPPVGGERFAVTAYLYSGCYSEDKIRKYFNI